MSSGQRGGGLAKDLPKSAARGPISAHAMHAAAGRSGGRAQEQSRVRRGVWIEARHRAGEQLSEQRGAAVDVSADVVPVTTTTFPVSFDSAMGLLIGKLLFLGAAASRAAALAGLVQSPFRISSGLVGDLLVDHLRSHLVG